MMPIQGSSAHATPMKQDGIVGIVDMVNIMRQRSYKPVVFIDFYCGSGTNVVDGREISGSPISMLEGIVKATSRMKQIPRHPRMVVFNDIVQERSLDTLPVEVEAWQAKQGLPVNRDVLTCFTKTGQRFTVPIRYVAGSAQDMCAKVKQAIANRMHVVALIDPNGPKDAPWAELRELYEKHSKDFELLIHVSSTALKRVAGARAVTEFNFAPMPSHVSDMLQAFSGCGGWIREPTGADQWTMVLITRFPPRSGWNVKNGPRYLKMDTEEGQQLIQYLSTTVKQRRRLESRQGDLLA